MKTKQEAFVAGSPPSSWSNHLWCWFVWLFTLCFVFDQTWEKFSLPAQEPSAWTVLGYSPSLPPPPPPTVNTILSSLLPRCPISGGPHLSPCLPALFLLFFPCDFKGVLEEKWFWTQPIVLNLESEPKFLYKLTSTSFTSFPLFFLSHSKNFDFIFLSPLLLLQSITEKIESYLCQLFR